MQEVILRLIINNGIKFGKIVFFHDLIKLNLIFLKFSGSGFEKE